MKIRNKLLSIFLLSAISALGYSYAVPNKNILLNVDFKAPKFRSICFRPSLSVNDKVIKDIIFRHKESFNVSNHNLKLLLDCGNGREVRLNIKHLSREEYTDCDDQFGVCLYLNNSDRNIDEYKLTMQTFQ